MIEFGKTLKNAREAKHLSISRVAEMTRMLPSVVEDLENENFSHIAAPIYGRGFVKLYCEAVGLEPKPMVAEFMEIYSGNRTLEIKERTVPGAPAPTIPVPETITQPAEEQPLSQEVTPQAAPTASSSQQPVERKFSMQPDLFDTPVQEKEVPQPEKPIPSDPLPSRYATPQPEPRLHRSHNSMHTPFSIWRLTLLLLITLLALWGAAIGIHALYRATATPKTSDSKELQERPATQQPAKAPRTPMQIPHLYID